MQAVKSLSRLACLLLLLSFIVGAQAEATVTIVIFRSPDSLTIYLPDPAPSNISGLNLQVTTATPPPTSTSTPTGTPTPTLISTPLATFSPEQLALTPVASNADWTPIERAFEGVPMMLVPAGNFTMGSTAAQIDEAFAMCWQAAINNATCERRWYENELIPAEGNVQTMSPFWIDKTEVTRRMYDGCVAEGVCRSIYAFDSSNEDDQPIRPVTWFWAQAYCEWRGARLPTEVEWEYAARGPDGLIFPWGDAFEGTHANHCDGKCGDEEGMMPFDGYVNEENDDGYVFSAPVGSYPQGASWVGALDMSGNVWEWVNSLYLPYPYAASDGREDTVNRTGILGLRGGSFWESSVILRAANRYARGPNTFAYDVGFRCARS
jgi:formylglycine-generating enzyme required for sulfatase activity